MKVSNLIVPCWGSSDKLPKQLRNRVAGVSRMLESIELPIKCFGRTASGDPTHPLMLGYNTQLINYFAKVDHE